MKGFERFVVRPLQHPALRPAQQIEDAHAPLRSVPEDVDCFVEKDFDPREHVSEVIRLDVAGGWHYSGTTSQSSARMSVCEASHGTRLPCG